MTCFSSLYTPFLHASLRWQILDGFQGLIASRDDWRFKNFQMDSGFEMVKSDSHRIAGFATLHDANGPQKVFIKVLFYPKFEHRLRYLFRQSKVGKEWRHYLYARAAGLPVTNPIAVGEYCIMGVPIESVLVTQYHENDGDLENFLSGRQHLGKIDVCIVFEEVGRLFARLQNCGVLHSDLNPGNLLLRCGENPFPDITLVDMKSAKITKEPTTQQRLENLGKLVLWFEVYGVFPTYDPSCREAFFRGYRSMSPTIKQFGNRLQEASTQRRNSYAKRLRKRCVRNNSNYATGQSPAGWNFFRKEPGTDIIPERLRDVRGLMELTRNEEALRYATDSGWTLQIREIGQKQGRSVWLKSNYRHALGLPVAMPIALASDISGRSILCSVVAASYQPLTEDAAHTDHNAFDRFQRAIRTRGYFIPEAKPDELAYRPPNSPTEWGTFILLNADKLIVL